MQHDKFAALYFPADSSILFIPHFCFNLQFSFPSLWSLSIICLPSLTDSPLHSFSLVANSLSFFFFSLAFPSSLFEINFMPFSSKHISCASITRSNCSLGIFRSRFRSLLFLPTFPWLVLLLPGLKSHYSYTDHL